MIMTGTTARRVAAGLGFLGVALGAFGAHALKARLAETGPAGPWADVWEKAVFYHFIHAVMLYVLAGQRPLPAFSWWSFLVGILLFSGSLYLLAVTQVLWLGAITPLGGLALLAGWGGLAWKTADK